MKHLLLAPSTFLGLLILYCINPLVADVEKTEDYEKRMELTSKATLGDVEAMHQLGVFFQLRGDHKLANHWYEKAGEKGHANSLWKLEDIIYLTEGKKDYKKLRKIYLRLIQIGQPKACLRLGQLHSNTASGLYDMDQALIHLIEGIDMKDSHCMVELALLNMGERGHPRNYLESAKWFEEAYKLGNIKAARYLGLSFRYGLGVEEDHAKAWKYYGQAARQDDADSLFALGEAMFIGDTIEKNIDRAVLYFSEAAKLGHRNARLRLQALRREKAKQ
ncbi:MAG: sel1 repeat family protein [Planctomycetes bacterium]|nr:sel1 repeat family protein [Planctomycetota bacterium]